MQQKRGPGRPPKKRQRTPFSANRKRLGVTFKDENEQKAFVHRWLNDQDGRVQRAEEAGYQFVSRDEIAHVGDPDVHQDNSDLNSKVSKVVGRTEGNQPIRAFLMKIPKEFYDEDQAAKEERNAMVDKAIRAGKAGGTDVENKYGDVRMS